LEGAYSEICGRTFLIMAVLKTEKICRLCGRRFFSNKRLYCEPYHGYLFNYLRRSNEFLPLAEILIERGALGARLENEYWVKVFKELNWLDTDGLSYWLNDNGGECLNRVLKERRK
jgi:hypothetical protein